MTEWQKVALGDGLEVLHGFAFKGEFFRDVGELIVLTPGNFIESGGFKPKSGKEKFYDGPVPPKFLLRRGDVVVAMTEQTAGLLGSSATIPADGTYLHNQRIGLLRVTDPALLDLRFVYHLMNTTPVRDQLQATATGAKVRHTAPERIKAVTVGVPELGAQRRIAATLDSIDDLIENNRRRVDLLEEIARAIYQQWFVRFEYPQHESVPFVDSTLGPIPDGWSVAALGDIAELVRANVQPSRHPDEPFDHFSIPAFDDCRLPVVEPGGVIRSGKYLLDAPAVMISKLNPRIERTWFAVPSTERRSVTSTEFLILRPRERSTLVHLYLLARSDLFQEKFRELSGGTSTSHQRAKPADFLDLKILCPPMQLVRELTDRVDSAIAMTDVLRRENRVLSGLRDVLLPRLVSGAIDVSTFDRELVGATA